MSSNRSGFTLIGALALALVAGLVTLGLTTFLVQQKRAQRRTEMLTETHMLRSTLADLIDCDATFTEAGIDRNSPGANCNSTTQNQVAPFFRLRRKTYDGSVQYVTGELDATTKAARVNDYWVRASCSDKEKTLVVRGANATTLDFNAKDSLLVGAISQGLSATGPKDARSLCYGQGTPGSMDSIAVATAGDFATCATMGTGLYCWGTAFPGGSPPAEKSSAIFPEPISGAPTPISAIAVSVLRDTGGQACIVSNNYLYCWGTSSSGTLTKSESPKLITGADPVDNISLGENFGCFTKTNTEVYCWGSNTVGQLGNGNNSTQSSPVKILSDSKSVSAGQSHACAALTDGTAKCWGKNHRGQLGINNNDTTDRNSPQTVKNLTGVTVISAGIGTTSSHSCAVSSGAAKCWGENGSGQLGTGNLTNKEVPQQVTGLTSGVTAISAGGAHTCAIVGGGLKCWGNNSSGQLGNGKTTSEKKPVSVTGMDANVTAVSCGERHTCAVVGGKTKCWGSNANRQLGTSSSADSTIPVSPELPGAIARNG